MAGHDQESSSIEPVTLAKKGLGAGTYKVLLVLNQCNGFLSKLDKKEEREIREDICPSKKAEHRTRTEFQKERK